jgi:hypothetical protein
MASLIYNSGAVDGLDIYHVSFAILVQGHERLLLDGVFLVDFEGVLVQRLELVEVPGKYQIVADAQRLVGPSKVLWLQRESIEIQYVLLLQFIP